jgi:hypothetical protein
MPREEAHLRERCTHADRSALQRGRGALLSPMESGSAATQRLDRCLSQEKRRRALAARERRNGQAQKSELVFTTYPDRARRTRTTIHTAALPPDLQLTAPSGGPFRAMLATCPGACACWVRGLSFETSGDGRNREDARTCQTRRGIFPTTMWMPSRPSR